MKTKIRNIVLLTLLITSSVGGFSQELPPALRNFLTRFGEASSLSMYNDEAMLPVVNDRVIDVFTDCFQSTEVMVYNDIYHAAGADEMISVQEYVEYIADNYPEGLLAYIYSPELKKVVHKNGIILYEVVVDKIVKFDFGMDDPPTMYFNTFSQLKLSIAYANNTYKILMIEEARSALSPQAWSYPVIPQSIRVNAAFNPGSLQVSNPDSDFGAFTSESGKSSNVGISGQWDVFGKKHFKAGLMAGVEYQSFSGSLHADKYHTTVNMIDKDNYPYLKIINAKDSQQDYKFSALSIPVGLHFNYSFGQKWHPQMRNINVAKKKFPVQRGLSLEIQAGAKFNYMTGASVESNTGVYNYSGRYAFANNYGGSTDSTVLIISNLPEYGFYSDTAFSGQIEGDVFNRFFVSGYAALNVRYPLNPWCEIFGGAVVNVSLSPLNTPDADAPFSSTVGNTSHLLAYNAASWQSFGVNAGLAFNLKPPKQEYYPYPGMNDLNPYNPSKSKVKFRGSLNKVEFVVNSNTNVKAKFKVSVSGEWSGKTDKFTIAAGKSKTLKFKVPADKSMAATGSFIIHKPFGVEIAAVNGLRFNDVDKQEMTIPVSVMLKDTVFIKNHTINLAVEALPDFNFVYVSLNGRDNVRARKDLVDELRKINRQARFENQEILIYVSTEINRPVVYCNFDIDDPQAIPYTLFLSDQFDAFIDGVSNKYNSAIMDAGDDMHNIEKVIGDNFHISSRLNAVRRYVNFYFLPLDATSYRTPNYIESADNTWIQNLIVGLTNKYCIDVPAENDQYKVFVHLRADQYSEINLGDGIPVNESNNTIILY